MSVLLEMGRYYSGFFCFKEPSSCQDYDKFKENAFEAHGIVQAINDYFHAYYREGENLNFSRKEL
jgi:hypothetical protein